MTKIIPTKFDNTRCRKCGCNIPYGTNVRWTKGEKGVTCVTCPGQVVNATTGAPVENETAWESLSRRFNIVQAEANTLRDKLATSEAVRRETAGYVVEQQAEIARLRSALAHELQLAAARVAPSERPEVTDVLVAEAERAEATDDNCPL
jgi:hypothetical protein